MTETPIKKKRGNPAWVKGHNKVQPVAQAEVADEAGKITAVDLLKAGPKPSEILEHLRKSQAVENFEQVAPIVAELSAQGTAVDEVYRKVLEVKPNDLSVPPELPSAIKAEASEVSRLRDGIQWIYNRSRGLGGSYPITLKCQELLKG